MLASLRFAARSLVREPGYALAFVLTLGLGIGANTAIFSLVNGVLLQPLPYPRADDIVYLKQPAMNRGIGSVNFSFTEIADYRERSRTVEEFVEFGDWTFNVLGRGNPHRANGGLVTANFFDVLGMRALHGRLLRPEDRARDAEPVAVLTHEYWQLCCGGDPAVVGQPLDLTVKSATIVGVLAPGSHYATQRGQDFYVNYAANDHYSGASMQDDRRHRMTRMLARIRPDVEVSAVRSELRGIAAELAAEYPDGYPEAWGMSVEVVPWREELTARARPTLWILLGTAAFVLVIACANVANLTLTRLNRREQEIAVRTALGASAARLRKLVLGETLLLALFGAGLGLLIATSGLDLLVAYVSRFTARTGEVEVDLLVLGFTLLVAVGAAFAFTLLPGVSMESRLAGALVAGGGQATAGRARRNLQRALVVGQVALSFMLLVGAGLLLRTLVNLYSVDPGFDLDNVLSLETPNFARTTPADDHEFSRQVIEQVGAHPGVESAALSNSTPLGGTSSFPVFVLVDGEDEESARESAQPTVYESVSPGYFRALGVPVLAGREFTDADRADAQPVAVVNRAFARRHFGDDNPVGRRVSVSFGGPFPEPTTIVGVVGDTRSTALVDPESAAYYQSNLQAFAADTVLVRTAGDPAAVTPRVVETIRNLDPQRPVEHVLTLAEVRAESIAPQRLNAVLFSVFALLALAIAAVGIAGVLAYSVSQRRREFGIRAALGADRGRVLRQVLREGGGLALVGLAFGAVGAWFLSRLLGSFLFEVQPFDPLTLVGVGSVLLGVALAAALVPARRAMAVHPAEALRAE